MRAKIAREIAGLQAQIGERGQRTGQGGSLSRYGRQPQHADQSAVREWKLIQRKSFSWTRVFEDLEQVMPPNLHVVSAASGIE